MYSNNERNVSTIHIQYTQEIVAKLKRSDIFPDHIFVVTQKTADGIKIELNNISQAILNKYKKMRFKNNVMV